MFASHRPALERISSGKIVPADSSLIQMMSLFFQSEIITFAADISGNKL